ncbi:MAG: hypothetical protein GY758_15370 [Fuerstiella sp.]|nr:hypothetical protein [Fuerstiella sp.]MDG2128742.1 hypothetical protein [Fuerstiella sp.]
MAMEVSRFVAELPVLLGGDRTEAAHREPHRVEDAVSQEHNRPGYCGGALFANTLIDPVRQQVLHLESCYERRLHDSGLRAYAVVNRIS